MNQYDIVIQLGSQVEYCPFRASYKLAPHTRIRTEASAIVFKKGIAPRLIVLGGSNFGVRYDDEKIYGATHPTQKTPVFTFEAFADSDKRKSEAAAIKGVLVNEFGIPSNKVMTETLSATTEENVAFLQILLKRRPMFTGNEKIGILTLLYHMSDSVVGDKRKPGALAVFRKAGLNVVPMFAENVLADNDPKEIDRICAYYSTPKSGKQYDVDRIRQLLTEGNSLAALMQ